jgi:hypothetical protein
MKTILLFTGIITLLASTGCIVDDGRRHGWRHDEVSPVVVVGPPVVVVRPPEVIVR